MSDFSKSPLKMLLENQKKGYIGIHIEQGVPILDRDLNLLNDLITATVRSVVSRYIGSGIASGMDGFQIQAIPADNDFMIRAGTGTSDGTCLIGGIEVTIPTEIKYTNQTVLPPLPPLRPLSTPNATQPNPREDTVFLDAWLIDVDGTEDPDLRNSSDVGMQTSVRQKPTWVVRVAEGVPVPAAPEGHVHYPLAKLIRPRDNAQISESMIIELRQTIMPLADAERRFRMLEKLVLEPAFRLKPDEFDPKFGQPGTPVTLFGKNLNVGVPTVRFGTGAGTVTVPASDVGTPTSTEVIVKVPTMPAGPVQITVETIGGSDVSEDPFIVLPLPAPTFRDPPDEFEPKFGPRRTPLKLFGNHFNVGTVVVRFGTVDVPASDVGTVTEHEINVTVPALATTGKITVQTEGGSITSHDDFTVTT